MITVLCLFEVKVLTYYVIAVYRTIVTLNSVALNPKYLRAYTYHTIEGETAA